MRGGKLVVGVFMLIVAIFYISNVCASMDTMCVTPKVTDINPSSARIGEDITVGIQLDNCGSELPDKVHFEITRFSKNLKIKEPLVVDFKKPFGYANSQRFNVYHIYVTNNATPGIYVFEYELSYGKGDFSIKKDGNFSITVTSQKANIDIAYIKTDPIIPEIGKKAELTIRLENFGRGDANSVKAKINMPFFGIKESFLGELKAGDDSAAVFTLIPDKGGIINYTLNVSYTDDFGKHEFSEPLEFNVQKKSQENIFNIEIIGIIILLIVFIIYYFKSKRRLNKKEEK